MEPRDRDDADARAADAALVRAALAGDPLAQASLYRRHRRRVVALASRAAPRGADVEDVVQDAFADAFARLPTLASPEAFGAWVGAIARRTAWKRARRARLVARLGLSRPGRSEPADVEEVASSAPSPEVRVDLAAALARLVAAPPGAVEALYFRHVEGLSLPEIAARLGVSLATVKRRLDAVEGLLSPWGRSPPRA